MGIFGKIVKAAVSSGSSKQTSSSNSKRSGSSKGSATTGKTAKQIQAELNAELRLQDKQLAAIQKAEDRYEKDGDLDKLLAFWEEIWRDGLSFNGVRWNFRYADLLIKAKRYDEALGAVDMVVKVRPDYSDKVEAYREKIRKKIN